MIYTLVYFVRSQTMESIVPRSWVLWSWEIKDWNIDFDIWLKGKFTNNTYFMCCGHLAIFFYLLGRSCSTRHTQSCRTNQRGEKIKGRWRDSSSFLPSVSLSLTNDEDNCRILIYKVQTVHTVLQPNNNFSELRT